MQYIEYCILALGYDVKKKLVNRSGSFLNHKSFSQNPQVKFLRAVKLFDTKYCM